MTTRCVKIYNSLIHSTSHVHLGIRYEKNVSALLESSLHIKWSTQSGGHVGDEGIDLRGSWTFPPPGFQNKHASVSFYVIGQCKNTKNRISSKLIREFEGVLQRNSMNNMLGLYVSTVPMTADSLERFRASSFPLMFIQAVEDNSKLHDENTLFIRQFCTNHAFQRAIPLITVTKLYKQQDSSHMKTDHFTHVVLYDKSPIFCFSNHIEGS